MPASCRSWRSEPGTETRCGCLRKEATGKSVAGWKESVEVPRKRPLDGPPQPGMWNSGPQRIGDIPRLAVFALGRFQPSNALGRTKKGISQRPRHSNRKERMLERRRCPSTLSRPPRRPRGSPRNRGAGTFATANSAGQTKCCERRHRVSTETTPMKWSESGGRPTFPQGNIRARDMRKLPSGGSPPTTPGPGESSIQTGGIRKVTGESPSLSVRRRAAFRRPFQSALRGGLRQPTKHMLWTPLCSRDAEPTRSGT